MNRVEKLEKRKKLILVPVVFFLFISLFGGPLFPILWLIIIAAAYKEKQKLDDKIEKIKRDQKLVEGIQKMGGGRSEKSEKMKFCPKCGSVVTSKAKYCSECGEELN